MSQEKEVQQQESEEDRTHLQIAPDLGVLVLQRFRPQASNFQPLCPYRLESLGLGLGLSLSFVSYDAGLKFLDFA